MQAAVTMTIATASVDRPPSSGTRGIYSTGRGTFNAGAVACLRDIRMGLVAALRLKRSTRHCVVPRAAACCVAFKCVSFATPLGTTDGAPLSVAYGQRYIWLPYRAPRRTFSLNHGRWHGCCRTDSLLRRPVRTTRRWRPARRPRQEANVEQW